MLFLLPAPAQTQRLPEDYVKRVKDVHEIGGYGSIGYNTVEFMHGSVMIDNK
jgi:hypothetical protein